VPMWQECLDNFEGRTRIDMEDTGSWDYTYPEGLKYRIPGEPDGPAAWYNPLTDVRGGPDRPDWNEFMDDEEYNDWDFDNRVLVQREPREYKRQVELRYLCSNWSKLPQRLQVVFKLDSVYLTPERPEYLGETWREDGGFNEGICASACYYYDDDNVCDGRVAFRQELCSQEMHPEQGNYHSMEAYIGIDNYAPAIQEFGDVLTREGRLLVYPNCLQHEVRPVSLRDKAKPGHRKMLTMFLIVSAAPACPAP
ncbi:DUF4246 family protein, partial [Candidatus Bathyarchaeota archaeon]|nr:DUF4246 family protein [Candidatus Bathyarchaeota archaeon]